MEPWGPWQLKKKHLRSLAPEDRTRGSAVTCGACVSPRRTVEKDPAAPSVSLDLRLVEVMWGRGFFSAVPYKRFRKAYGNSDPSRCWEFGKNTTSEAVCYKSLFSSYFSRRRGDCSTDHTPYCPTSDSGLTPPTSLPPS